MRSPAPGAILVWLLIVVGAPGLLIFNGWLAGTLLTAWGVDFATAKNPGPGLSAFGLWALFTLAEGIGTWLSIEYVMDWRKKEERRPRQEIR